MFTKSASVFYVWLVSSLTGGGANVSFTPVYDSFGSVLCAVDNSSVSTSMEAASDLLPDAVQCGYRCSMSIPCRSFNVRPDDSMTSSGAAAVRCQLLEIQPSNLQIMESCTMYSVGKSIPRIPNVNCSYPFTYGGQLYYNCATDVTNVTSTCEPYACFTDNRTAAVCNNPSYVATFSTTRRSITNRIVPVRSVFGWIIISQKQAQTSVGFRLPIMNFTAGFGILGSDYWFGLNNLRQLTMNGQYKLRVELQSNSSLAWYSAEYWYFVIGDELTTDYQLNVAGYTGDAGDSLAYTGDNSSYDHNGMKFSALDNDITSCQPSGCRCTQPRSRGGWWYTSNTCIWTCLTCNGSDFVWGMAPTTSSGVFVGPLNAARMMIKLK